MAAVAIPTIQPVPQVTVIEPPNPLPTEVNASNVELVTDLILFPNTGGFKRLIVQGKEIRLRPLPLKHARAINWSLKPLQETDTAATTLIEVIDKTVQSFMGVVSYILMYYHVDHATPEWVDENLTEKELKLVIDAQMAVEDEASFLLQVFQLLYEGLKEMRIKARLQAQAETLSLGAPPTSPTVEPGTSPSSNSSPTTPEPNSLSSPQLVNS